MLPYALPLALAVLLLSPSVRSQTNAPGGWWHTATNTGQPFSYTNLLSITNKPVTWETNLFHITNTGFGYWAWTNHGTNHPYITTNFSHGTNVNYGTNFWYVLTNVTLTNFTWGTNLYIGTNYGPITPPAPKKKSWWERFWDWLGW